jgi:Lon protease-like protein
MAGQLGLFPLGIVVLPGEQVPLHVFEPRYRELVGECLEEETPFGILLTDDNGLRALGTKVRIVEVVERFEDGRLVIVVEGTERFRLVELMEGRSFQTGEVEAIRDEQAPAEEDARKRALDLFEELRDAVGADVDLPEVGDPELSWAIGRRIEIDARTKQALLESRSERERIELLTSHLQSASAQLALVQEHMAAARRNGNLRQG